MGERLSGGRARSSRVCCTRVSSQSIPVPGSTPRNKNPEYFKPDYFLVNMYFNVILIKLTKIRH